MAWTTPKTWVAGNALTAAELNEQVRDNSTWLKSALAAIGQTSDSTVGSLKSAVAGARVYRSSDQNITDSTWTSVSWGAEQFDLANGATAAFHNNATNPERITIPSGLDGYYLLWANITWDTNTTGRRAVRFVHSSGTTLGAVHQTAASSAATRQVLSVVYALSAGDYVTCDVWQDSGGTRTVDGTSFSALPAFGAVRLGV